MIILALVITAWQGYLCYIYMIHQLVLYWKSLPGFGSRLQMSVVCSKSTFTK